MIQATLKLSRGGELVLDGCEGVQEQGGRRTLVQNGWTYPSGLLTLSFAQDSDGLKELHRRIDVDDGDEITGTMTIVDSRGTTHYDCGFKRNDGCDVTFTFTCIGS